MFRRLQRLLGGDLPDAPVHGPVAREATKVDAFIFSRSANVVEVVGESFYQEALMALGRRRGELGVEQKEHMAALTAEPSNPKDPMAVQVQVNGLQVGYLDREDARTYRPVLDRLARHRLLMGAPAMLIGGWDRGYGDVGSIGVQLHIGTPAELWQEMDVNLGAEPMPTSVGVPPTDTEPPKPVRVMTDWDGECAAKSVCFTGPSGFRFRGQPITREMQELLAAQHGLTVAPRVTMKLDILVIGLGHPHTGKVQKAESYGTLILDEVVFWSRLGVKLDG